MDRSLSFRKGPMDVPTIARSGFRTAAVMLGFFMIANATGQAATPEVDSFEIEIGQEFCTDVAPTEDGDQAIVLFDGSEPRRVALIDAVTRSVVEGPAGTFDQRVLPFGGSMVGRKLYISSWFQLLSVDIDTKLVTILHQPPFSTRTFVGSPVAVSASRHRVYTISASDLLKVDTATENVVVLAELDEGTYGIAVSPDEQRIYVVDSRTGLLTRFDAMQGTELGDSSFVTSRGIENSFSRVTVGPDGLIYVGYVDWDARFNVSVLDPVGILITTKVYNFFSTGLDMTRDGKYLIAGNGSFIDRSSLEIVAQAQTGRGHNEVHVTVDGRYAYVSNYNSTFVSVIEIESFPLTVTVDIQPAGFPRRLDWNQSRLIPVTILSTADFDATTVDPASVCFGSSEDPDARSCVEAHHKGHLEDADGDGDIDLMLHYLVASTGIAPGDGEACLTAQTYGGVRIAGCDTLRAAGR